MEKTAELSRKTFIASAATPDGKANLTLPFFPAGADEGDLESLLRGDLSRWAENGVADSAVASPAQWANIKYQFTPDLSVRIGRTVLPSFLYSDTRKIGYANPWVRPPVETYSLVPIDTSDGVDASYDLHFGEFLSTLVVAYGHEKSGTPAGSNDEGRRLLVIADTIERHTGLRVRRPAAQNVRDCGLHGPTEA